MEINYKLIEALDKIIEKYSKDSYQGGGPVNCPFCCCLSCRECPNKNSVFDDCGNRGYIFPALDFRTFQNYPNLKEFWSNYKELYLQGYDNEMIMGTLIEPFK